MAEAETPSGELEGGQYDAAAIALLKELRPQRRPWQMLLTRTGAAPPGPGLYEDLGAILDLFPGTGFLTVHTAEGCLRATRDFPSNATQEVDDILARLFQANPEVTGVTFPGTATRPAHTATPDDPFWSAQGKTGAAITAALEAGTVTPGQAIEQFKYLYAADAAATAASEAAQDQAGPLGQP